MVMGDRGMLMLQLVVRGDQRPNGAMGHGGGVAHGGRGDRAVHRNSTTRYF